MFTHPVTRLRVERNLICGIAVFIVLVTNVSVLFDLPIVRQVFGFMFLTILPGLLLFQFLKLKEIDFWERMVLCWGVSIAFVMFYTLLINAILPQLGNTSLLSSATLLLSFDCVLLVLIIMVYRTTNAATMRLQRFQVTKSNVGMYMIPLFFPLLGVIGSYINNATNDNVVLLVLFFLMPAYVAFVCLSKSKRPKSFYPFVVLSISLATLLLVSLRSSHIIGADLNLEYYQYVSILNDHHMVIGPSQQSLSGLYAGVGSIAVPVAYQLILGTEREVLFNSIYAVLFLVVPLIVYVISRRYVDERYALIASFVYMAQASFIAANYNSRTTMAILFFACAFAVLFSSQKSTTSGRVLIIVFVTAGIMSHYSTAYLFLLTLALAVIVLAIVGQKRASFGNVNPSTFLLYFSVLFLWWGLITASAALNNGLDFIRDSLAGVLFNFFSPATRSTDTQSLFGAGVAQKAIGLRIEFVFTWALLACLAIGMIALILRRKEMTTMYQDQKPPFLRAKFEADYFALALGAGGVLLLAVAVPNGGFYSVPRTYFFAMTILSPFFVIGAIVLANWSTRFLAAVRNRRKKQISSENANHSKGVSPVRPRIALLIALMILGPYFLCASGAIYSIEGAPRSVLDSQGTVYFTTVIHDQDADAAMWIALFGHNSSVSTADMVGRNILESQGHIPVDRIDTSSFLQNVTYTQFFYLYDYNVIQQKYLNGNTASNMTDHSVVYSSQSRVYDAGASQVYLGPQGVV